LSEEFSTTQWRDHLPFYFNFHLEETGKPEIAFMFSNKVRWIPYNENDTVGQLKAKIKEVVNKKK